MIKMQTIKEILICAAIGALFNRAIYGLDNLTTTHLIVNMENKITYEDYDRMWFDLEDGYITEAEWREFCDEVFKQMLEENKDVMIRLTVVKRIVL